MRKKEGPGGKVMVHVDVETLTATAVKLTEVEEEKEGLMKLHTLENKEGPITAHVTFLISKAKLSDAKPRVVVYGITFGELVTRRAIKERNPRLFHSIANDAIEKLGKTLSGL